MDQCLPWHAALHGTPFPAWLRRDLAEIRARKLPTQVLYVALTPTRSDRRTLAAACADAEGAERPLPPALRGKSFASPEVKRAYLAFVRRIADALDPDFLNLGIEISELALQHPAEWPAFAALFRHTVDGLRRSHPKIRTGLELVLQSILQPATAALVKPTAEYADFIGISFYPYGSEYGVALGAPPLPAPREQWRAPLRFLRGWTTKPIAIAETGYTTRTIRLADPPIRFPGTASLQRRFLRDLIDTAVHDRFLFVVWFVPVDYPKLLTKLEAQGPVPEALRIWMHAGLWDAELRPKPAFATWRLWREQAAIRSAARRF